MKRCLHKYLAAILAVCMLSALMPAPFAEDAAIPNNDDYDLVDRLEAVEGRTTDIDANTAFRTEMVDKLTQVIRKVATITGDIRFKIGKCFSDYRSGKYLTIEGFKPNPDISCAIVPISEICAVMRFHDVDFTPDMSAAPTYLNLVACSDYPHGTESCSISNPYNLADLYDSTAQTVTINTSIFPKSTQYIVVNFPTAYADIISVANYDYEIDDLKTNADRIPTLVKNTGSESLYTPFAENVYTKLATLNDLLLNSSANTLFFGFITDVHWSGNIKQTYRTLNYLYHNAGLRYVFYGGDTINGGEKAMQLKEIKEQMQLFTEVYQDHFYTMFGNHERNPYGTYEAITDDEIYNLMFRHLEPQMQTTKFYYFIDNQTQKTRYFILNTGVNGRIEREQMGWFANQLLDIPDSWDVVVFGHWFYNSETSSLTESAKTVIALLGALKEKTSYKYGSVTYDYSNRNNNVICMICGHTHCDLTVPTGKGFPLITTTCDKVDGNPTYTYADEAFDVFVIDKAKKTINAVRFGKGKDRSWKYT